LSGSVKKVFKRIVLHVLELYLTVVRWVIFEWERENSL